MMLFGLDTILKIEAKLIHQFEKKKNLGTKLNIKTKLEYQNRKAYLVFIIKE